MRGSRPRDGLPLTKLAGGASNCAGRMTTIEEDTFYGRCQAAGEAITARSGLPDKAKFPVL